MSQASTTSPTQPSETVVLEVTSQAGCWVLRSCKSLISLGMWEHRDRMISEKVLMPPDDNSITWHEINILLFHQASSQDRLAVNGLGTFAKCCYQSSIKAKHCFAIKPYSIDEIASCIKLLVTSPAVSNGDVVVLQNVTCSRWPLLQAQVKPNN